MTAEAFAAALSPAELAAGSVQVWVTDVDQRLASPAPGVLSLTPDERRRAKRFRNPIHGKRWSAGRAFLRATLASHLRCDPSELLFDLEEMGKPFLVDSALSFNLSHSGERVVVAVTAARDVGIDVEELVDRGRDFSQLAEAYFTPGERTELEGASGWERVTAFYRCWTRKEAVMKADGSGLAVPPETINVGAGSEPERVVVDPPWQHLERYHLFDLTLSGPYASALAAAEAIEVTITAV